jgi:hypothetical protein
MTIRKLSRAEAEALLEELANRTCNSGCKCIFCRTFDEGRASGMEDAQIAFERSLDELKRKQSA